MFIVFKFFEINMFARWKCIARCRALLCVTTKFEAFAFGHIKNIIKLQTINVQLIMQISLILRYLMIMINKLLINKLLPIMRFVH